MTGRLCERHTGVVPRGDSRSLRPCDYAHTQAWLEEDIITHHGAGVAQQLARRLTGSMADGCWSTAALSRRSGVNRLSIAHILAGRTWPDLLTVASLEQVLDRDLWPSDSSLPDQASSHESAAAPG